MAISCITITSQRSVGVDFTIHHAQDSVGLLFEMHTDRSRFFLNTFDFKVWLLVFAMPIVSINMYFIAGALCHQRCVPAVPTHGQTILDIFGNLFPEGRKMTGCIYAVICLIYTPPKAAR